MSEPASSLRPGPALVDEIVLAGAKVQVLGRELGLDDIQLDPTNPRLANTLAAADLAPNKVQQRMAELLWGDRDVQTLFRSVKDNGGLIERIIVRSNGVVAEGNCRIVVYRKLADHFPDDPRWKRIPARVLPEEITERQVAVLLGELHVGGKNEWSPFEKAGHIHKLYHQFGLTQDEIAKLLRTSKTLINHNIHAFEAMKNHYMLAFPGAGAVRKFSHFLELYKKPELREWVKDDPEALTYFVDWVGTEKIEKGADVRELVDFVSSRRALAALKSQGRDAAMKILQEARPELTSPLFQTMIEMTEALDEARLEDIQRVRKDKSGGAKAIVRNLKASLDRFVDLCDGLE